MPIDATTMDTTLTTLLSASMTDSNMGYIGASIIFGMLILGIVLFKLGKKPKDDTEGRYSRRR
jgi:hypothetical protein